MDLDYRSMLLAELGLSAASKWVYTDVQSKILVY